MPHVHEDIPACQLHHLVLLKHSPVQTPADLKSEPLSKNDHGFAGTPFIRIPNKATTTLNASLHRAPDFNGSDAHGVGHLDRSLVQTAYNTRSHSPVRPDQAKASEVQVDRGRRGMYYTIGALEAVQTKPILAKGAIVTSE